MRPITVILCRSKFPLLQIRLRLLSILAARLKRVRISTGMIQKRMPGSIIIPRIRRLLIIAFILQRTVIIRHVLPQNPVRSMLLVSR